MPGVIADGRTLGALEGTSGWHRKKGSRRGPSRCAASQHQAQAARRSPLGGLRDFFKKRSVLGLDGLHQETVGAAPGMAERIFLFFQGVSEHADGRAPKGWGSGRMGQRAKGSTAVDRQASRGGGVEERRQGPTFVRQTAQRTVRARKTKLGVGSTRVSESGTLLAGLDVIGGRAGAYHAITPSHA